MEIILNNPFLRDFVLGGISGATAKTVSAPLERVKLLLQTQESNFQLIEKKYKSMGDCFVRIYREEGVLAYWRGNWANVLRYFPTMAFNFAFKDYFLSFNKFDPVLENKRFLAANMLSGGMAGVLCALIVYPLDFARTRLGVDIGGRQFNSLSSCLNGIVRLNGIRGIYQGLGMSLISVFTYRAMYFGFFDTGKRRIDDFLNKPLWFKFCFAQFVTAGSETLNYPTDTIRRRMMMNAGLKKKLYNNSIECTKSILKNEGIKGFYKGCFSNAVRSISSSLVLV